jgi:hypothetical protein
MLAPAVPPPPTSPRARAPGRNVACVGIQVGNPICSFTLVGNKEIVGYLKHAVAYYSIENGANERYLVKVGVRVYGTTVGTREGLKGMFVDGLADGVKEGFGVGRKVGSFEGFCVGTDLGAFDGFCVGPSVGALEGF